MKNIYLFTVCFLIAHAQFSQTLSLVQHFNTEPDPDMWEDNISVLQHLDDKMIFFANDGINGHELWVTDGTTAGTLRVSNLEDSESYAPIPVILNGKALFFYDDTLYAGDESGTTVIMDYLTDYTTGTDGFATEIAMVYNGDVYYLCGDNDIEQDLYVSDGTAAGTQLIHDSHPVVDSDLSNFLGITNNKLLLGYQIPDIPMSEELFRITPVSAIPQLVKDIKPGDAGSFPKLIYNTGSELFFIASDATHGDEVWITNGVAGATVFLGDINPGTGGSNAYFEFMFNGEIYFTAYSSIYGRELYHAPLDGSPAVLLKNINPGTAHGVDYPEMAEVNGVLLFDATDNIAGTELWRTDGTSAGTYLLKDINPGLNSSNIDDMQVRDSLVYFIADNGPADDELWVSDGTAAGTFMLKDVNPGGGGIEGDGDICFPAKGTIFLEDAGAFGEEWWVTDGTSDGTVLLKDINPGPANSEINLLPVYSIFNTATVVEDQEIFNAYNGVSFFLADNGVTRQLWQTDGSTCGTFMIADVLPEGVYFPYLYEYGDKLFLTTNTDDGSGLWVIEDLTPPLTATITPEGPTTFCKGGNVILNANNEAGYTFQWYKNGTPVAGGTGSSFMVNKTGNYTVLITSGSCTDTSDIVTVTVNPKPNATITNVDATNDICFDANIKLKANTGAEFTYQWFKDGFPIAGATSGIYYATAAGNYNVKITTSFGCAKISSPYTIINTCKLKSDEGQVRIYPNPAQDVILITHTFNTENISLKIFSGDGGEIQQMNATGNELQIDLKNYAAGIYFIEIKTENEIVRKMFEKL